LPCIFEVVNAGGHSGRISEVYYEKVFVCVCVTEVR